MTYLTAILPLPFAALLAVSWLPTTTNGLDEDIAAALAAPTPAERAAAADRVRAAGPDGLRRFFECSDRTLAAPTADPAGLRERFRLAAERIGKARDNDIARLYWFTDLEAAKAEAVRTHRPILSLRLLGKLDEELSCANSRFFRTALYANAGVGALLRDGFVLHWESVRPVPKMTIDFGDGRVVERTITGNSIHYVLDSDGAILDALPGLYGPETFLAELEQARAVSVPHDGRTSRAERQGHWNATLARTGMRWPGARVTALPNPATPGRPDAAVAMPRALAKAQVETRPLRAIAGRAPDALIASEAAESKSVGEQPILRQMRLGMPAGAAATDRLDAGSLAVLRRKCDAGSSPEAIARTVAAFEQSMAADTVQNDGRFRPMILGHLLAMPEPIDLRAFNDWVYDAVFLTPGSDPWLGLLPADVYTGIENDGRGR
jgi:hypothetical protein